MFGILQTDCSLIVLDKSVKDGWTESVKLKREEGFKCKLIKILHYPPLVRNKDIYSIPKKSTDATTKPPTLKPS